MSQYRLFPVSLVLCMLLSSCVHDRKYTGTVTGKKLLQFGQGTPMAHTLPDRITDMETWNPAVDAMIVGVTLRGEVRAKAHRPPWEKRFCWCVFGPEKVTWENVAEDVAALAKASRRADDLELFLRHNVLPGTVDMFDPRWEAITHNAAITGRMVREGGCKGLIFDTEQYGKEKYNQGQPFSYEKLAHADSRSFEEYAAQAQLRGRQWIEAFQKEAPEAVILFTFAHSNNLYRQWKAAGGHFDKGDLLTPEKRGLLTPAFIDGILEGAGAGITLIDGCEFTYGFRTWDDFRIARMLTGESWRISRVPELYRQKMQCGFATWMDMYYNHRGGFYPDEPENNYFTPRELAVALNNSLRFSDSYCWVWSEEPRWWPHRDFSEQYIRAFSEAKKEHPFGIDPVNSSTMTIGIPPGETTTIPHAADLRGRNSEIVFRSLWDDYQHVADLPLEAKFKLDPDQQGHDAEWFRMDFDDSAWRRIRVDEFWEHQGFSAYNGLAWYRVTFSVPRNLPDSRLFLSFGKVDEKADVWLNGKWLGKHPGPWNRRYEMEVTGRLNPGEPNHLVLAVTDTFGAGGLWAPVKLIAQQK